MGDFLDDYLDGLSSGQRFNPLPYGPYHGTKDKRQWHLLADGEREQAIFEARVREEEESASAAAEGAAAEGGSAPIPEKLMLDRRFVPDIPPPVVEYITAADAPVQYAIESTTETFGFDVDVETGTVPVIEQTLPQFTTEGEVQVSVVEDINTHPDATDLLDTPIGTASYGSTMYELGTNSTYTWVTSVHEIPASYPGAFQITDYTTDADGNNVQLAGSGYGSPAVAIGADFAVQFKCLIKRTSFFSDDFGVTHNDYSIYSVSQNYTEDQTGDLQPLQDGPTTVTTGFTQIMDQQFIEDSFSDRSDEWKAYNLGKYYSFDLNVHINVEETPRQILDAIEAAYQAQTVKEWSYGIITIEGVPLVMEPDP